MTRHTSLYTFCTNLHLEGIIHCSDSMALLFFIIFSQSSVDYFLLFISLATSINHLTSCSPISLTPVLIIWYFHSTQVSSTLVLMVWFFGFLVFFYLSRIMTPASPSCAGSLRCSGLSERLVWRRSTMCSILVVLSAFVVVCHACFCLRVTVAKYVVTVF